MSSPDPTVANRHEVAPAMGASGPPFSRPGNERVEAEAMVAVYKTNSPVEDTNQPQSIPANIFGGNKRKDRPNGGFYVEMDAEVSKTLDANTHLNPSCAQGGTVAISLVPNRMVAFGEYVDDDSASTLKQRDYKDHTDLVVCSDVAPTIPARSTAGGGLGTDFDCDGGLVTYPIDTMGFGRIDDKDDLRRGLGVGEPNDPSFTITKAHSHAVAYNIAFNDANGTRKDRPSGGLYVNEVELAGALIQTESDIKIVQPVAFSQNGRDEVREMEVVGALAERIGKIRVGETSLAIRRLVPEECEKLQGFERGFTNIRYKGKPAADGPRYKALGNSMAVPVLAWLGKRIQLVNDLLESHGQHD